MGKHPCLEIARQALKTAKIAVTGFYLSRQECCSYWKKRKNGNTSTEDLGTAADRGAKPLEARKQGKTEVKS
ncbi:hypothetical protein HMPREF1986_00331 [Oribacterium sp. oral taxon 078 str. F0263]|nr:hypothetical protein HMPREF1986_00331 [Oribacterium sp. oral taxon 078 str. F0263]